MEKNRWWHLGIVLQLLAVLIAVRAALLIMGITLEIPYLDPILVKLLGYAEDIGRRILPNF